MSPWGSWTRYGLLALFGLASQCSSAPQSHRMQDVAFDMVQRVVSPQREFSFTFATRVTSPLITVGAACSGTDGIIHFLKYLEISMRCFTSRVPAFHQLWSCEAMPAKQAFLLKHGPGTAPVFRHPRSHEL